MTIKTLATITATALFSTIAVAQIPVTDAAHIAQTVFNGITMIKQLEQAYTDYQHMVYMAKYLSGTVGRWGSLHQTWWALVTQDTYGTNGTWATANNTGAGITSAMAKITTPIDRVSVGSIPTNFQTLTKRSISSIERHDSLIAGSAAVIGAYSVANPGYVSRLTQLANSVTGTNADELTYAAQMQKQSAAIMLNAQGQNVGVEIQKQMLLNQQVQMIAQREAAVKEVNAALYTYANAEAALIGTTNTSGALQALRIP
jgi:hypothetical protein